jgi:guanylate kinase
MPLVVIISAPSGSGKSTLVKRLMESDPLLDFSTSVTTRPARAGEIDGESYRFLTEQEFLNLRDRGELLEWAEVFGNYYGTARSVLEKARQRGHDLILDIDVQGAGQLREKLPGAVTVFILPPSRKELEARLRNRSSDPDEVIERRLRDASREVSNYKKYDYILVNDELETSFEKLRGILLAERCRKHRVEELIKSILNSFETGNPNYGEETS